MAGHWGKVTFIAFTSDISIMSNKFTNEFISQSPFKMYSFFLSDGFQRCRIVAMLAWCGSLESRVST